MAGRVKGTTQGQDIPAIALLEKELSNIRALKNPPDEYSEAGNYRKATQAVIDVATITTKDVYNYAQDIQKKLDEMRKALQQHTTVVQEAIKKTLNRIKVVNDPTGVPSQALHYVNELLGLEVSKKRLEEAVIQSQEMIEKIENNAAFTLDDFEKLKGCIDSWANAKKESYEDEKRRLEEERRRRAAAEKKRKEDEERRKREEKERREREEKERREREEKERREREEEERREREEKKRRDREEKERREREEEERKKQEEEEKRRQEEEERKRLEEEKRLKEEEERQQQEEEERRKREEEERIKKEEEEARRKQLEEEERRRLEELERKEAERRERERIRLEEEEKRRRLDPRNWNPIIYSRDDSQRTDSRSHHQGVCCAVMAVPGSIQDDDLQCIASDNDTDILPTLTDGEKILSSVITLNSQKGQLDLEAPMRVYVPHHPVHDSSDELVVKVSVNGSDWVMDTLIIPPPGSITDKNIRIAGVELPAYETAKVVVVARPRSQSLIIDKPGTSQYSQWNKNVKIFVPRDAFKKPTECKFLVKSVPESVLSEFDIGSDCPGSIITTGPVVSLACQTPPTKDIEIDILKSSDSTGTVKTVRGKTYQLYKTNKSSWQIADVEFKGKGKDVSISLPALKYLYSILEIEVPQSTSREDVIRMAKELYDTMNKTVVRMVVKQSRENPEHTIVHCVGRDYISRRIEELTSMGYTAGPDTSREFYLFDGQKLCLTLTGNIESAVGETKQIVFPFYAYMDTAKENLVLRVKDKYKQRDMHEYAGHVHCQILPLGVSPSITTDLPVDHQFDMPISLPKTEKTALQLKVAPIRFPYHLSALAEFVSWKLTQICQDDNGTDTDWFEVLCWLEGKKKMNSIRKYSKHKCTRGTDQEQCRIMLLDWMKATHVYDDKTGPILSALKRARLYDLASECENFVTYQKETMTDSALHDIADIVNDNPSTFGSKLGLNEECVTKCVRENIESATCQILALLMEWRISSMAAEKGVDAFDFIRSLVNS